MESSSLLLLVAYMATLVLIIGGFLFMRKRNQDRAAAALGANNRVVQAGAVAPQAADDEVNAGGAVRRRGLARMRQQVQEGGDAEEDGAGDPDAIDEANMTKEQKKQLEKERKRLEKEARRQMEEDERKARQKKDDARSEARRTKEEERERRQKELEEAELKAEEERKKKEEEMYNEWKDAFSVEQAGSIADMSEEESQGLLQKFIDFIKTKKVVILDDLAAEFGLRTQDAVERVKGLEQSGAITGVLDDRGKFIYITPEEFASVAAFIKRRGRVTISDIVAESNKLIDLGDGA